MFTIPYNAGVYKTVIVKQVDTVQLSSLYNKTGCYSVYHFLSRRWMQYNGPHFIMRQVGTMFTISCHADGYSRVVIISL